MKKFYYVPEVKMWSFWAEKSFMSPEGTGQDLDDPVIIDPFATDEP